MESWDMVDRHKEKNFLQYFWAFKRKHFPDVNRLKGQNFEIFAPVVQCNTIRPMMVILTMLGLETAKTNITMAFIHQFMEEWEDIYVKIPQWFCRGRKFYNLNLSRYGPRKSTRKFIKYLCDKIGTRGIRKSDLDPCIFIGRTFFVVSWVYDLFIYSLKEKNDPWC